MPAAPSTLNEAERLKALGQSRLLEDGSDPKLDAIVARAAALFGAPIAAVSLVGEVNQHFKASVGLGVSHTSRDVAFCAYTILGPQPLIVLDAPQDPRFADNALVLGAPGIRFYIGAPVFGSTYHPLGALCVIDTGAHSSVSQEQIASLHALSVEVSAHFAIRSALRRRHAADGPRATQTVITSSE